MGYQQRYERPDYVKLRTFSVRYLCGHYYERKIADGPGFRMVSERMKKEAAEKPCYRCEKGWAEAAAAVEEQRNFPNDY